MKRQEKGGSSGRETSQRQLKMGERIRQVLSEAALRADLRDAQGQAISLTFSEVRCSPDLRNAKAFYVPLGHVSEEVCELALKNALPELQNAVAKKNTAKYTPKLAFIFDTSFDQADHMRALLDTLQSDDE